MVYSLNQVYADLSKYNCELMILLRFYFFFIPNYPIFQQSTVIITVCVYQFKSTS